MAFHNKQEETPSNEIKAGFTFLNFGTNCLKLVSPKHGSGGISPVAAYRSKQPGAVCQGCISTAAYRRLALDWRPRLCYFPAAGVYPPEPHPFPRMGKGVGFGLNYYITKRRYFTMKRPLAYITAAWCGSDHENTKLAAQYCRTVYEAGFSPICPTLYQPLFLNDAVPEEHKSGIDMGRDLLRRSHVLVVCGHTVTEAMKNDIAVAQRLGITATTLEGILTVKGQGRR